MDFPENETVFHQLSSSVKQGRLAHAILLEGAPGSTSLARWLAMAALCSAPAPLRPCGDCPHCRKAKAGMHPDLTCIEGLSAPRALSVDVIRTLRAQAVIKPNEAAAKVFLLLDAQAMTPQAQNALLKILEEPPPGVYFLLTCRFAEQLLPTVRSRMQVFSTETSPPPDEESRQISSQAGEIARACVAAHETELLCATASLARDRERFGAVLEALQAVLRDACVRRAGGLSLLSDQRDSVTALCQSATRRQLLAMLEVVQETQSQRTANANSALLQAAFCARLRRAAGK